MVEMPIVLKRWTPTFDAKKERVDEEPIWVRLSGLPMQFWNSARFVVIGNMLGSYIEADMSFEDTGLMSVARILVRLNLRPGLLQELTIESTVGTFVQILDYEGIPFRCHRCHAYGHGIAECPLPYKGKLCFTKGSVSPNSPSGPSLEVQLGDGEHKEEARDSPSGKVSLGFPPNSLENCSVPSSVDGPKFPFSFNDYSSIGSKDFSGKSFWVSLHLFFFHFLMLGLWVGFWVVMAPLLLEV
jgi:hypothetical protein